MTGSLLFPPHLLSPIPLSPLPLSPLPLSPLPLSPLPLYPPLPLSPPPTVSPSPPPLPSFSFSFPSSSDDTFYGQIAEIHHQGEIITSGDLNLLVMEWNEPLNSPYMEINLFTDLQESVPYQSVKRPTRGEAIAS